MHGRSLLLTGLLALSTSTAAGGATLPARTVVGPEQGVQASASGSTVTVRFTGAAAAWGASRKDRKVWIECDAHPRPGLLFTSGSGPDEVGDLGSARVSADGASVRITFQHAPGDACVVHSAQDASLEASRDRAYAALTPAGAAWIDEQSHGLRMADVLLASQPHGVYRPAAEVVASGGGEVVALDDPNGTPPAGRIGYWSTGRAMSVVGVSAAGRRLVLQDIGDGMLRTNVFEALLSWAPAEGLSGDALAAAGDASGTTLESDDDAKYEAPEGVLTRVTGDQVTFRFTGKAARVYRRLAGRRVVAGCYAAPSAPLLGEALSIGSGLSMRTVRVPAHGGTIRVRVAPGHHDVCGVELPNCADVAFGTPTRAGRRYLISITASFTFSLGDGAPSEFASATATSYPGVASIVAAHAGLVPMATPGQALKVGQYGVWTDAGRQALLALGAADGLRFVLADEGDGMLRTNVFTPVLSLIATLVSGGAAATS